MLYTISEAGIMFAATRFTCYPVFGFRVVLVTRYLLHFFLKIKPIARGQVLSIHMEKRL